MRAVVIAVVRSMGAGTVLGASLACRGGRAGHLSWRLSRLSLIPGEHPSPGPVGVEELGLLVGFLRSGGGSEQQERWITGPRLPHIQSAHNVRIPIPVQFVTLYRPVEPRSPPAAAGDGDVPRAPQLPDRVFVHDTTAAKAISDFYESVELPSEAYRRMIRNIEL